MSYFTAKAARGEESRGSWTVSIAKATSRGWLGAGSDSVNLSLGVHRDGQSETMTCKCVQEAVHTQELRHHRHSSSSEHRSTQTVFSKCHSPGKVKIMASQKKKKKRLGKKNTSWPGVNKCSKQKVTCLKDSSDGLKHFFFPPMAKTGSGWTTVLDYNPMIQSNI